MKGFKRGLAILMAMALAFGTAPAFATEDVPAAPAEEAGAAEGKGAAAEVAGAAENTAEEQETDLSAGANEGVEEDALTGGETEDAEGESSLTGGETEDAEAPEEDEKAPEDGEAPDETPDEDGSEIPQGEDAASDDGSAEGLNGTTVPVDSSTTLADGTYSPEAFAFSGGTGKTKITCEQVTVLGGKAAATIVFSSSKYGYVKASGEKYDPISTEGGAKFEIPVDLNAENKIIALTTAMTEPHEVEYTITVTLTEPEKKPDEEPGYEDGDYTIGIESTFSMFKIAKASAKVSGGKVTVTLSTEKKTYDRIHLDSKNDEASYDDFIQGTPNDLGGYDFTFELPASYMGQSVDFVPGKSDGSWYSKNQYQLTIPEALEKAPDEPEPVKTFNVKDVYAEQDGGILNVVLTSDSADFDKIFIGTVGAASKTPNYARRTMADGVYYYEFTLSASNLGKEVRFVPGCPDGTWLDQQMTFTVPEVTALPERPADSEYADGSYTAAVPVYVEGSAGLANSALDALYTEVTIQGETLTVTIWNRSSSYNQLYVGKLGDADVTVIDRVEEHGKYSDAYYRYTFTLPKSALGTLVPVVPGKDGAWASKQNYMAIPKYLTVVSLSPVDPDPKPEEPAVTVDDGEYSIEVESSASMFKVVACTLTAKDGKYTAVLTLSGTGYDKLFMGAAEEAAKADASALIPFAADAEGKYTFAVPVEALDKGIAIAAHSVKNDLWYDRTLTFKSSTLEKIEKRLDDGKYSVAVESSASMFKVVACTLTAKDGAYIADITLSGTGYDKLFMGAAEEAAKADASALIGYTLDGEGRYTFTVPVEALDKGIAVAAHSEKKDLWYDRTLTFKSEGLTKIEDAEPTPVPTPTPTPEPTQKPEEDLNGSTGKVDASTALADGTYTPDKFSFSGGTGKVTISCTKVTVSGGKATATLVFSSPNYGYVKANGQKIYGSHTGSTSTFEVPVELNKNNRIIGMTTAMSADHEVTYTIYVYIEGANGEKSADGEDAPQVAGLTYQSADAIEHAEGFKVYRYEEGVIVIDVKDVARYMVVPEGIELPVGVDEGMIRIDRPVNGAYVGSDEVLTLLAEADEAALCDKIALVGCAQEDCPAEAIAARMAEELTAYAGSYDAPNYALLLKAGCNLAIMPADYADSAVLGTNEAAESQLDPEFAQALLDVGDHLSLLDVALFVDRSTDEATEEDRLEWIKVYGILFDCEDAAQTAYGAAVSALDQKAA